MFCVQCGKSNPEGAKFCAYCGAQMPTAEELAEAERVAAEESAAALASQASVTKETKADLPLVQLPTVAVAEARPPTGLAIASLVLGILGLFTMGFTALIGLVLGIVALVRSNRSGRYESQGLAIAGIAVSGALLVLTPLALLPVLRAREKARTSSCMSNVKQIALGLLMYSQDYDERFPLGYNWNEAMYPYIKNNVVFVCPQKPDLRCGYALCQTVVEKNLSEFNSPAEEKMLFDARQHGGEEQWNFVADESAADFRHNRGLVVGFVDGHCKWLSQQDFSQLSSNSIGPVLPGGPPLPPPSF